MFDREVVRDFKMALRPFLPLIIVMALVFGVGLGLICYALLSSSKTNERPYVTVSHEDIRPIVAQTPAMPAGSTEPQTQAAVTPAPITKPKPAATSKPAPATQPASPSFSISFSADGCIATVMGQPGTKVIIGAFNDRKGGESRYFIPASGVLVQSSGGGILGMTSFAQILAGDGSQLLYKTSTINQSLCPPAGVAEWEY